MVVETTQKLSNISKLDCFLAVSKKLSTEDFTVLTCEENGFDEIQGYLGEHSTLKVQIERNGIQESFHFFVKSPPKVHSQLNFLTEVNGIFKEAQFYTRYCPLLKKTGIDILDKVVSPCYLIKNGCFVFEDLHAEGYETLPSRIPLTVDYIKAALTTFAKLHASGLILEEKLRFRLVDNFGDELKESFYSDCETTASAMGSCKTGISALIDLTHSQDSKISKDFFREKALEGCDLQKVFAKPSKKFRNTICHADPWTKNFLFKSEKDRISCVVVDFQTYRYGPPAQDVCSFLYLVTDRQTRDESMKELLEFYYGELSGALEKFGVGDVVSRGEFFESCQYFRQFALTQSITHCQVVILSDEVASELFSDPERAKFVLFENKYEFFKMVWHRDPVFRRRNSELIEELRELYEEQIIK